RQLPLRAPPGAGGAGPSAAPVSPLAARARRLRARDARARLRARAGAHGGRSLALDWATVLGIRARATLGDEAVDTRRQHRQRHRAQLQHRVMEVADVELRPECRLGLV